MIRNFTRNELVKLGLPDSEHVIHTERVEERRWYSIHEDVFRAPDDGKLWRVRHFEPLTEIQEHDTWNEATQIGAVEVEPYEETITRYRPVADRHE